MGVQIGVGEGRLWGEGGRGGGHKMGGGNCVIFPGGEADQSGIVSPARRGDFYENKNVGKKDDAEGDKSRGEGRGGIIAGRGEGGVKREGGGGS